MLGIIMGSTFDIFFLSGWMCFLSRGAIHDASVYSDGAMMLGRSRGAANLKSAPRRLTLSTDETISLHSSLWWLRNVNNKESVVQFFHWRYACCCLSIMTSAEIYYQNASVAAITRA
jgi:hypothetical protein